jgi:16S rRNA (cytosine967-C5)-methyltransferase
MANARQLAWTTLKRIQKGSFADVALHETLASNPLEASDRGLMTELVYGCVRQQRTLDALIDQFGNRKASQQPPDLRLILHLGFYQLRYLSQIPDSAVVDTAVELAKSNQLAGLAGVVNGMLRHYLRSRSQLGDQPDVLRIPDGLPQKLGIQYSYPDWLLTVWATQIPWVEVEQLCIWMNHPPHLDIRINPLRTSVEAVSAAMQDAGIDVAAIAGLPHGLRVQGHAGAVSMWPGFEEGWWVIQDASAQWVAQFLDPQPGEMIVDACAAPGGKTTHIAELMQDQGIIWACDRTAKRLRHVHENLQRLGLQSIQLHHGDSCHADQFRGQADRVLVDAPCSGLGTLHRHADARWRQTPETVQELVALQRELLRSTATWVKPGGILLYATCTLHPAENDDQIRLFLSEHPDWRIVPPTPDLYLSQFVTSDGWVKIWPQWANMDGFFMAKMESLRS